MELQLQKFTHKPDSGTSLVWLKQCLMGLAIFLSANAFGQTVSPNFTLDPTDNPFGIAIGEIAIGDLDNDGDLDIISVQNATGVPFSYHENTGTASVPSYATAVSNPFGLSNTTTNTNYLALADLDGDGDLDLINKGSTVCVYFENTGTATSPTFASAVSNPFGLGNMNVFFSTRISFVDIDADGDLDLFGVRAGGNTAVFMRNNGTATAPSFGSGTQNPFGIGTLPSHNSAFSFIDMEGDGDLDILFGAFTGGNIQYFENIGNAVTPNFTTPLVNPFGLTGVTTSSNPKVGDFDGDGDLDIITISIVISTVTFRYIENTSTNYPFTFSSGITTNPFGLTYADAIAYIDLVDIDADGDLDIFAGESGGNLRYFENTGTALAPAYAAAVTNPFGITAVTQESMPIFADIDADGDLDLFLGRNDITNSSVTYFENTGSKTAPAYAAGVLSPFGLVNINGEPRFSFYDIDADGDLDAFQTGESGNFIYYQNTGDATNPAFATAVVNPFGLAQISYPGSNITLRNTAHLIDIDKDGDLDLFSGSLNGYHVFFENTGTASSPAFATQAVDPYNTGMAASIAFSDPHLADIDGDGSLDFFSGGAFTNISFKSGAPVLPDPTWNGSAWVLNPPTATDNAILAGDYDVATDGDFTCLNLTINSGINLTQSSGQITIKGNWVNNGNAFNATGGTVEFSGATAQAISGDNDFYNFLMLNGSGVSLSSATGVSGLLSLINGTITTNDQLYIVSDATGTGMVFHDGGLTAGDVTVQRFLNTADNANQGYRYFSSPVASQTVADIDVTSGFSLEISSAGTFNSNWNQAMSPFPNFYFYGESRLNNTDANTTSFQKGWNVPTASTASLTVGKGFTANLAPGGTVSMTGALNNGVITVPCSFGSPTNAGWHLMGNPYAAPFDWDYAWTNNSNNFEATSYTWSATGKYTGAYQGYNAFTNVDVNGGSQYVPSMQSFFIRRAGATGSQNFQFENAQRANSYLDPTFLRTKDEVVFDGFIRLELASLTNPDKKDEWVGYFMPDATAKSDALYDGHKIVLNGNGFPSLLSYTEEDGKYLMMDARPSLDTEATVIPLHIYATQSGKHTLKVSELKDFPIGTEIMLEDRETNQSYDLSLTSSLEFDLAKDTYVGN